MEHRRENGDRQSDRRFLAVRNDLRRWSECGDLNPGPLGPEPSALPSALHPERNRREMKSPRQLLYYNDSMAPCQEQKPLQRKNEFKPGRLSLKDGQILHCEKE